MKNKLKQLFKANAKRGQFRAAAEENAIYLYDFIAGDDFEAEFFGGTSPMQFIDQIKAMKGDVAVHINSPGGDVFGGQAIAEAIRQHDGNITAYIDGVAASIASIIAVACDKVVMAPGATMMIHKAWTVAVGNSEDMMETATLLDKIDGLLSQAYATKSGKDAGDFAKLMSDETWLTPDECRELGLCDEVSELKSKAKNKIGWDLSAYSKAPTSAMEAEISKRVAAELQARDDEQSEYERRQRIMRARLLDTAA